MVNRLEKVKDILMEAALVGGEILKQNFGLGNLKWNFKSSNADIVTQVDIKIQKAVTKIISENLPGVQIISEEKENKKPSREVIYLDPIDGTLNFCHGQRQVAISIGYWKSGKPYVGVVFNPIDNDLFFAISGRGAFRNNQPIHASKFEKLKFSILATGWPYNKKQMWRVLKSLEHLLPVVQEVRVWGTAALAICYLAAGNLEAYWEWEIYPWDIAAAIVIAKEAGCQISSLEGKPFKFSQDGILVSNGLVHKEILSYLLKIKEGGETQFS